MHIYGAKCMEPKGSNASCMHIYAVRALWTHSREGTQRQNRPKSTKNRRISRKNAYEIAKINESVVKLRARKRVYFEGGQRSFF
jgi:hypothetical protein